MCACSRVYAFIHDGACVEVRGPRAGVCSLLPAPGTGDPGQLVRLHRRMSTCWAISPALLWDCFFFKKNVYCFKYIIFMYENTLLYNINKWILWNINNFQEFYTMCSDCILPASPNSFQTHALSYSPSLHPSLHQGQLVPSRYSWMCGLPPERGTYQGYTLRENWSFLSRQLTLANSSSARGRP